MDAVKTATHALTVTITDVNDNTPVFSPSYYTFSISENIAVNAAVGTVTATDDDTAGKPSHFQRL